MWKTMLTIGATIVGYTFVAYELGKVMNQAEKRAYNRGYVTACLDCAVENKLIKLSDID